MDAKAADRIVKTFIRTRNDLATVVRKLADEPNSAFLRGMAKVFDAAYLEACAAYDALPGQFQTVSR